MERSAVLSPVRSSHLRLVPEGAAGPGLELLPPGQPERELVVEFVGLTPEQQRRALSGWPGALRFVLADA